MQEIIFSERNAQYQLVACTVLKVKRLVAMAFL